MEYEAKLLKASRQNADFLQQHHQVMNQDVIRKKMQHMKENYDREVASLKAQIVDLQQRLESTLIKSEDQNKNPSLEKQKQSKLKLLPHHYIFQEKQSGKRSGPFEPACRPDRKSSRP
ncbi:unnamed protein product [Lymnaea stagnalis]|uniref:Uncharacterized protein n=1 Tax=Lymnaea stagnalis TaxID=6523 RepID=A0AAV2IH98_LYMST